MSGDGSQNWVPAEEAAQQIEERLPTDADYRAEVEAAERRRQEAVRILRDASRPILNDLENAGIKVQTLWVPDDRMAPHSTSLPILLAHLDKGAYPDEVMGAMARCFAVKPAIEYWDRLRALYHRETGRAARSGLAAALAKIATRAQFDDLVELLHDESLGESRIILIGDIVRVGRERGKDIVRALVDDPVLGKEATARARRWK